VVVGLPPTALRKGPTNREDQLSALCPPRESVHVEIFRVIETQ